MADLYHTFHHKLKVSSPVTRHAQLEFHFTFSAIFFFFGIACSPGDQHTQMKALAKI